MNKITGLLIFLSISFSMHAAYLVDNSETGTPENTSGGTWITFTDGFSTVGFVPDATPGQAGIFCRRLDWTFHTGAASQYAGAVTSLNGSWSGTDLSVYTGVRFHARGYGLYEITLATSQTSAENNHYSKKVFMNDEWTLYELPFSEFAQTWGTPGPWDPATVYSIGFNVISASGNSGQLWIDNIEFYLDSESHPFPDPNVKILKPKVNQTGYLPKDKKYFSVTADSVPRGEIYTIVTESGTLVYTGTVSGVPLNDLNSSGETVWKVDFSSFEDPGVYRIKIREKESYLFEISDSVYNDLFRDALRSFYLIRCGLAENDPVTGINRPACHTSPAQIRGSLETLDATGGWHNAGDMGLFVNETAISISYMLWLYELRQEALKDLATNIPESGNSMSDLLDEAKWGLMWLMKMQKTDGTVYHKADGEPHLFDCIAPDQDPVGRKVSFQKEGEVQTPSSIDAADFTGVMAQAARVFSGIDGEFAATCLDAANKSWAWVNANPGMGQTDPYYPDPVSWQEFLWAKAEMACTLNNTTMRNNVSAMIDTCALTYVGWGAPHLFGYMALYYDPNSSDALKSKIKSKIQAAANTMVSVSNASGYGVALQGYEYWWESNENVLAKAVLLLVAHEITAASAYRNAALSQLNYILGLNSLDKSFVMRHGSNAMEHPWHWIYLVYGMAIPGWTAGGPNSYGEGADYYLREIIDKGAPPAKCYADVAECDLGSWAGNEGETSENAALVFLSGYFYHTLDTAAVITGQHAPQNKAIQAFPSPCFKNTGCPGVFFTGIPDHATLKIFSMKGQLVYSATEDNKDGELVWSSSSGSPLHQGNYIFTVNQGYTKLFQGKFSVVE